MTTQWTCDTCGEPITDPEHGWVEWLSRYENEKRICRGLRLVHHHPYSPRKDSGGCQYDQQIERRRDKSIVSDSQLPYFMGADGLMRLLAMLAEESLPKEEVLEMIKRLHIPGYEDARDIFDEAISAGVFEPNTMPGFYHSFQIDATLEYAKKRNG